MPHTPATWVLRARLQQRRGHAENADARCYIQHQYSPEQPELGRAPGHIDVHLPFADQLALTRSLPTRGLPVGRRHAVAERSYGSLRDAPSAAVLLRWSLRPKVSGTKTLVELKVRVRARKGRLDRNYRDPPPGPNVDCERCDVNSYWKEQLNEGTDSNRPVRPHRRKPGGDVRVRRR